MASGEPLHQPEAATTIAVPGWLTQPLVLGLATGLTVYFGVVRGVLNGLMGGGFTVARMLSDPLNVFSFSAFAVGMFLILRRHRAMSREARAFALGLVPEGDGLVLPDDALAARRRVRELPPAARETVLVALLTAALERSRANWSAQDAGDAVKVRAELIQVRTDADYAPLRYIAWAIPTIGFVSTILGLAGALKTMKGVMAERPPTDAPVADGTAAGGADIGPALEHLFQAFDTTFVALLLTLVLMLFFYLSQAREERLLARAADWCLTRFVFRMHTPAGDA